jgi:hypothetical protein
VDDDNWDSLGKEHAREGFNRTALDAWKASHVWLTVNRKRLHLVSLHQAFNDGYLAGLAAAKGRHEDKI